MTAPSSHSPITPPNMVMVAGIVAILLLEGIWSYDLWPPDEPRFAQVSREMLHSGDYLAPHINGEPYREKPPLLFWAIALVSAPFGDVTETTARIPSVLAAFATCWCAYLLARRMYDPRIATWAVLILATTSRFWWQARTAQIDMLLTACLTFALLMLWRWREDRSNIHLVCFYAAIAAGLLAKGPPALVFPLLLIVAFYWKQPQDRKATHYVIGTLAAVAVVALWLIPARMAVAGQGPTGLEAGIGGNLFRQTIGRFLLGVSHGQPPWYYILRLPLDLLPWSFFLPYTLYYIWKRRKEGPAMRYLLAYTIPALLFFSISIGKRQLYLLPLYPVFSILIARSLCDLIEADREKWRTRTAFAWSGFLIAVTVAPFAILQTEYAAAWTPMLFLFSAIVGACSLHATLIAFRTNGATLPRAIALHIVLIELMIAAIVLPQANPYKSASDFCQPIRELAETHQEFSLYSLAFSREEYVFYTKTFHQPLLVGLVQLDLPQDRSDQDRSDQDRSDQSQNDIDVVELQIDLRKSVARAVRDLPIADIKAITDQEREALQEAIDKALEQSEISPELQSSFIEALNRETQSLAEAIAQEMPAFILIQNRDYRWLHLLIDTLSGYKVQQAAKVGSRDMLLLATPSAAELLSP